jgi:hypothetical protein
MISHMRLSGQIEFQINGMLIRRTGGDQPVSRQLAELYRNASAKTVRIDVIGKDDRETVYFVSPVIAGKNKPTIIRILENLKLRPVLDGAANARRVGALMGVKSDLARWPDIGKPYVGTKESIDKGAWTIGRMGADVVPSFDESVVPGEHYVVAFTTVRDLLKLRRSSSKLVGAMTSDFAQMAVPPIVEPSSPVLQQTARVLTADPTVAKANESYKPKGNLSENDQSLWKEGATGDVTRAICHSSDPKDRPTVKAGDLVSFTFQRFDARRAVVETNPIDLKPEAPKGQEPFLHPGRWKITWESTFEGSQRDLSGWSRTSDALSAVSDLALILDDPHTWHALDALVKDGFASVEVRQNGTVLVQIEIIDKLRPKAPEGPLCLGLLNNWRIDKIGRQAKLRPGHRFKTPQTVQLFQTFQDYWIRQGPGPWPKEIAYRAGVKLENLEVEISTDAVPAGW